MSTYITRRRNPKTYEIIITISKIEILKYYNSVCSINSYKMLRV
jgi:hypothetical protein